MIKIVRAVALTAVFAVPLSALVVSHNLFFPFIIGKAIMFRTLTEIAFFAWVLLALFDRRYRPRDSHIVFVFALFVAWMFIANLFAVNPHKAFFGNFERMEGWNTLLHLFLFFMVLGSVLRTRKLWRIFWFISLGVSAIISFDAVSGIASGARIGGMLGNPAYLAAYALFHIFIAAYYFFNGQVRTRAARLFLFTLAFLNLIVLFYSGTRSAMLGLFAGISITAFLIFIARYGISRKTVILTAFVLSLGATVFFLAHLPGLREHLVFSRVASISLSEGRARLTLWRMALEGAKERPLFGWGQEGYNYVFNGYYKPSLFNQAQWFDRAHNTYLEWLVAGGVPAFMLYLIIFGFTLRSVWKYEGNPTSVSLLIGIVSAYAVHSFFVFDNLITSILLVATFAYAHALSPVAESSPNGEFALPIKSVGCAAGGIAPLGTCVRIWHSFRKPLSLTAVVLCFTATQFYINIGPLAAGRELARALASSDARNALDYFNRALSYGFGSQEVREQLALFSLRLSAIPEIPSAVRVGVAQAAIIEMSKQVLETPKDVRVYMMRSTAYRAFPDAQNMWRDLEKARELSPRKQALFLEQGGVAYLVGDKQTAAALFLRAYELDESFAETAAYAGAGLIATGKISEGQAILQKHFGTAFPNHSFVQQVYKDAQ